MTEEPEGPLIITYLLTLPQPVPIQDMATHTVMGDEDEPLLKDTEYSPVEGVTTGKFDGRNFVSLQFLQHRETSSTAMARQVRATGLMIKRIADPPGITDPPDNHGVDVNPDMTTFVSAVTFARDREHIEGSEGRPGALTRCIDALLKTHRAFRLQHDALIPELTYQSIFPMVPWFTQPASATRDQHFQGYTMLDHTNFGVIPEEVLQNDDHEQIALHQIRLHNGDPFMLYVERRLEARRSIQVLGRYDESCVQTAIAAEVLLGGLLGLMLWEEFLDNKVGIESVIDVLGGDTAARVQKQYHIRLGATWALDKGVIGDWYTRVAALRNRVVHAGYRPTVEEASQALVTLEALERFVGDRLSAKVKKYPRTAWSFLGEGGFERRGTLATARRCHDQVEGNPLEWTRQYQEWRTRVGPIPARRKK